MFSTILKTDIIGFHIYHTAYYKQMGKILFSRNNVSIIGLLSLEDFG